MIRLRKQEGERWATINGRRVPIGRSQAPMIHPPSMRRPSSVATPDEKDAERDLRDLNSQFKMLNQKIADADAEKDELRAKRLEARQDALRPRISAARRKVNEFREKRDDGGVITVLRKQEPKRWVTIRGKKVPVGQQKPPKSGEEGVWQSVERHTAEGASPMAPVSQALTRAGASIVNASRVSERPHEYVEGFEVASQLIRSAGRALGINQNGGEEAIGKWKNFIADLDKGKLDKRARMFLPEKISPQVQAGMQVATKAALGALGGK